MRRLAAALAAVAVAGLVTAGAVRAQDPVPPVPRDSLGRPVRPVRPDSLRRPVRDSSRAQADSARADSARGRGGQVPTAPTRRFPQADSIIERLIERRGFRATRYAADSVQLLADEKEIRLSGQGLIEREQSTLEADTVRYVEQECLLVAAGQPRLFDPAGTLTGTGMRYDACNRAGIVEGAKTEMSYGSGKWLMVGDIAVDNAEDRIYAADAVITSCLMIDPHYSFESRQVKWVSKTLMVSRPAVLYVADVPVLWLPFIFQDTRRGRRSGVLAPQFGINDIIRFNAGYTRHISNVGYYFAISDYTDAQVSMDWFASRYTSFQGGFRYRLLDRFMEGNLAYQEMHESTGLTSRQVHWRHMQQFSLTSQLSANIDYATSSRIVSRNAVDPILATGTIDSRLNYQRRFAGGTLNLGGSRNQSLDKPQVSISFPSVSFTPAPIALSRAITWSPGFSFTNNLLQNGGTGIPVPIGPGIFDSLLSDSRSSTISLSTPFRIRSWTLPLTVAVTDVWSNQRETVTDTTTGAVTTYSEQFETTVDWNTGIGLPVLFQGSWNLQPAVSMVNTAGGAYMIRNGFTDGQFVSQGKRFQFAVGAAPTFFGLFPGVGPVSRFRHALSPVIGWQYSPAADIPLEYAKARNRGQVPATLTQPARQSITLGLSQNIEAKLRPAIRAGADTLETPEGATPPEGRKIKLLSIQSGGIGYDFEQAKLPGRNGWTTDSWSNTISSDLVRGFTMNFAHDLWDGPVGTDSARFAPTLTSMTFGFSIGAGSLNLVRRVLGLAPRPVAALASDSLNTGQGIMDAGRNFNAFQRGTEASQFSSIDRLTPSRGGGAFQAQLSYSLQRQRPQPAGVIGANRNTSNSQLSGTVQFSPTSHWTVSWQTSYNFTDGEFGEHVVRLDRDLHDWRATFTFMRSPNGNVMFSFVIHLIDEPDIRFPYDQRNVGN